MRDEFAKYAEESSILDLPRLFLPRWALILLMPLFGIVTKALPDSLIWVKLSFMGAFLVRLSFVLTWNTAAGLRSYWRTTHRDE